MTEIDLDLAPIGNCQINALIDADGRYLWSCFPRPDGDPLFGALLGGATEVEETTQGIWSIDLWDQASSEQHYLRNTPILVTRLTAHNGDCVEIIDFAPRYQDQGRVYRPTALVRMIRPVSGAPRIRVRLRPMGGWHAQPAQFSWGSNHIRYLLDWGSVRLTTDMGVGHILNERWHRLESSKILFLGPDEPFYGHLADRAATMLDSTQHEWRHWVRSLAIPLQWQDVVIRSAITLKLCAFEETGAILAAMTTSIPEAPGSERNWDYRFCWIRDAYYTVQALNRLGALDVLENYLRFLRNIVDESVAGHIQPLYGIGMEPRLTEWIAEALPGYRGMGPVRVGNQAHEHFQHDAYGQIILSSVQAFFDQRLYRPGSIADFEALSQVGERAFALHDQPDAGLWEYRTRARIHTYSALMCWAACDRLANAASALGLHDRHDYWRERATIIRARIEKDAWSEELNAFSASFGTSEVDASLLQMLDLKFITADDPRFAATVAVVEKVLRRGNHMLRYIEPDDFGIPETAFNVCTFWLIEALHLSGRQNEACALFEQMLANRTRAGLLSEDSDIKTGKPWGNYPQSYSLVGLINCASMLSRPWTSVR